MIDEIAILRKYTASISHVKANLRQVKAYFKQQTANLSPGIASWMDGTASLSQVTASVIGQRVIRGKGQLIWYVCIIQIVLGLVQLIFVYVQV